jgi:glycerol-3-phosphate dehydrogenase
VRHELARTLDDVLARRIPARWLAARASSDAAEATARLVAPELGWDESTVEAEVAAYRAAVAGDLPMDVGA